MARSRTAPLTSDLQPWAIRVWNGQNTKVRDTLLDFPYGVKVQNARFENEVGSVSKRDDVSFYNATKLGNPTDYPVRTAYRFYRKDGTAKLFATYFSKVMVGNDVNGIFTELRTGYTYTDGKKFTFLTYKDLCLFSNGFEPIQVSDGSTSWDLGSCKAATGSAGAITRTNISYQITMDNDAYVCGAFSNEIAALTAERAQLTNIPIGPVGTANRKIYRKSSETGGQYKLVATIANNTATTYEDNNNDVSAGAVIPAVTDPMPKGDLLQLHRERLFISGDPNQPNRVYYSRPYLPWYIQVNTLLDYMDISADDGDQIMGIPIWLGVLNCIKKNSIRRVYITQATSGADPDTWYADDPTAFPGAVSKRSITVTPYGIWYLGWDHWYSFDGVKSEPILDEFNLDDISPARFGNVVGYWHNNIFYAAFTERKAAKNYNDSVMTYNMLRKAMSIDKVNVDCFTSRQGGDESGDLYYGDSVMGFVYRAERKLQIYTVKTGPELTTGGTLSDVFVDGPDDDPFIEIGRAGIINDLAGTIDNLTGTIDRATLTGYYESPALNINAGSLGSMYWNEIVGAGQDVVVKTRTASTEAGLGAASYSAALTDPNGSPILSTADKWFQFKIELATDSYTSSPRVYLAGGYVIKFTYNYGAVSAEASVPFVYNTGARHFAIAEDPTKGITDKIFKKIVSEHDGGAEPRGVVKIFWTTEDTNGVFEFDLVRYPKRWESFFPAGAFGRWIQFEIVKNDLFPYTQKELYGLYTPEPIIV